MKLLPAIDRHAYKIYVRFRFITIPSYIYILMKCIKFNSDCYEALPIGDNRTVIYYAIIDILFLLILVVSYKFITEPIIYWCKKYIISGYYYKQQLYIINKMTDRYLFFRGFYKNKKFSNSPSKKKFFGFKKVENNFLGLHTEIKKMIAAIDAHDYNRVEKNLFAYDASIASMSFVLNKSPIKSLMDLEEKQGYNYDRLMGEICFEKKKNLDPKAVERFTKQCGRLGVIDSEMTIKKLMNTVPSKKLFNLTRGTLLKFDSESEGWWGDETYGDGLDNKNKQHKLEDEYYDGTRIHKDSGYVKNEMNLAKQEFRMLSRFAQLYLGSAIIGIPFSIYRRLYLYTFHSITFFHTSRIAWIYYFRWLIFYFAVACRYIVAKIQVERWSMRVLRRQAYSMKIQNAKITAEARLLSLSSDTVLKYDAMDQLDRKYGSKSIPCYFRQSRDYSFKSLLSARTIESSVIFRPSNQFRMFLVYCLGIYFMIIRNSHTYTYERVWTGNRKSLIHLRYSLFINMIFISISDVINYDYDNVFKEVAIESSFLSQMVYLDAISIILLSLTNSPCASRVSYLYYSVSTIPNLRSYLRVFSCSFLMLIGLFSAQNALISHTLSESTLIPLFLSITIWGSRGRKIHAAFQSPSHTLMSSILIIFGLSEIYFESGTMNMNEWEAKSFSSEGQIIIFICIFLGFMSKIPAIPSHTWLPEAHVEAPTVGSVLLAGVLLKISGYGILRILYNIRTFETLMEIRVFFIVVAGLSTIYSALCATVQIDLKKIIAYSSIVHTNFSFLGIPMGNSIGFIGSILLMFSHGLISAGLFFCVGMLYDRFKTRNILYYGGLVQYMPLFSTIFFIPLISNSSFPGTRNSVGEMFVFISIYEESFFLSIIRAFSTILVMLFSINISIRVIFLQITGLLRNGLIDSNIVEIYIGLALINFIIISGINPMLLIELLSSKSMGL